MSLILSAVLNLRIPQPADVLTPLDYDMSTLEGMQSKELNRTRMSTTNLHFQSVAGIFSTKVGVVATQLSLL